MFREDWNNKNKKLNRINFAVRGVALLFLWMMNGSAMVGCRVPNIHVGNSLICRFFNVLVTKRGMLDLRNRFEQCL